MVTEVTHESWFSRLGNAFKGLVIGGLMFLVSFPLLFWNEGRAVKTAKGLAEGAGAVVKVDAAEIDAAHEGKFVHASGLVQTPDVLIDEAFGVSYPGIRLERHVEMYQWKEKEDREKKKKLGGGTTTTTTYSYQKTWSNRLIDSDNFKEAGHSNPSSMPFHSKSLQATNVSLGSFRLPTSLVNQIDDDQPLSIDENTLPAKIAEKVQTKRDGPNASSRLYWFDRNKTPKQSVDSELSDANTNDSEPSDVELGDIEANLNEVQAETTERVDSNTADIGDVRIWLTATPASEVSVMSKQYGESFEPFATAVGTELNMLAMGNVSPEAMITKAEADNVRLTWILRAVGVVVMFLGLAYLLRPLAVLGDVVPFLGSVVEFGTSIVAGLVAISLSLVTISIAWIVYRPLLGIGLLLVAFAVFAFMIQRVRKKRSVQATSIVRDW